MISRQSFLFTIVALCLAVSALGFAPASTVRPAKFVTAARPSRAIIGGKKAVFGVKGLQMSSEEEGQQVEPKISADGTFYDDEVDSAPKKEGISDSMRARLMAEASTGLDSDSKQTNVLLYIIGAVAVLVVLGGAGIFY